MGPPHNATMCSYHWAMADEQHSLIPRPRPAFRRLQCVVFFRATESGARAWERGYEQHTHTAALHGDSHMHRLRQIQMDSQPENHCTNTLYHSSELTYIDINTPQADISLGKGGANLWNGKQIFIITLVQQLTGFLPVVLQRWPCPQPCPRGRGARRES